MRHLAQHFTDADEAKRLVLSLVERYGPARTRHYLEPSCGGTFVDALVAADALCKRIRSTDLEPKLPAEVHGDFLESARESLRIADCQHIIVVGDRLLKQAVARLTEPDPEIIPLVILSEVWPLDWLFGVGACAGMGLPALSKQLVEAPSRRPLIAELCGNTARLVCYGNVRPNLLRSLQDAFDKIAFICQHGDFYAGLEATEIADSAYTLACQNGCPVEMPKLVTDHDALRLAGLLMAWAKGAEGRGVGRPALTPPQVARRLGVNESKVRAWIGKGLLKAVNVAADPGGQRPRWRVSEEELAKFHLRREAKPLPTVTRSRPRHSEQPADFVDFFPDHAG